MATPWTDSETFTLSGVIKQYKIDQKVAKRIARYFSRSVKE